MAPSGHTTNPNEAMYPLDENRFGGLTKREYFAIKIYTAILTSPAHVDPPNRAPLYLFAEYAVHAADQLIGRLNAGNAS